MRPAWRTLVVVGVAVVVSTGATAWMFAGDPPDGDEAPAGGWGTSLRREVAEVGVLVLGRVKASDRLTLLGNVDVRQVELGFRIGGRIAAMKVEEGDAVAAGQHLASLESSYMEDELRLARARVAAQTAVVERLANGTRPEELNQARAMVAEREAALQLARVTLARQQELADRGVAPHQRHDEAQARVSQAEAQLQTAQEALRLAEVGPRREDIDAARAQLEAEQAALIQAERRFADTQLVAPSDGTIQTRAREVGAIVTVGETVYALSLAAPVWVRAYVDEPDLNRVRPGMPADVTIDSLPGQVYRGQVGFISPIAEFTPKTVETRELRTSLVYRLRVIVAEPDDRLRQGMPVTVTLGTGPGS